jgi:hypothetical protein
VIQDVEPAEGNTVDIRVFDRKNASEVASKNRKLHSVETRVLAVNPNFPLEN